MDPNWDALHLADCSAPPIVGGYGFDIWGEPDADALPAADEALREAFCAAKRASCGAPSQYAPEGGFGAQCELSPASCPCIFVLHYCPEFAAEAPECATDTAAERQLTGPVVSETQEPTSSDAATESVDGCSLAHGRGHTPSALWAAIVALAWALRRRRT